MATRSDQLQSHQFVLQRVVGALAMRDPDLVSSPTRRVGGALFASVMVAVLALAAVGVYGLLRPAAGDAWRDGDALVIEDETGARLVYRGGVLHPVLNYSSALLILGAATPTRARVPGSALVGIPRGAALGIPGAPDLLAGPDQLLTAGWTLCSRPAAGVPAESVLLVGSAPAGAVEAFDQRGLIARDPVGGLHLLWNSRRYAISEPELVLTALAWPRQAIVPAAAALLNAVPAGADLSPVRVERADRDSPVAGLRIGQVYVVTNTSGNRQFGVARPDGLSEITSVQADLLLTDGANGPGGKPKDIGQAQYVAAPKAASLVPDGEGAPPATTPQPVAAGGSATCATFGPGTAPRLSVVSPVPHPAEERRSFRTAGDPSGPADWIAVPPGRGAVVEALAGPNSPTGTLAVVTDQGTRYPVPSRDVLATLGYAGVAPQRLPSAVVALLPAGPALDPATAAG